MSQMDPKIYLLLFLSPVLAFSGLILIYILTRPIRLFLYDRRFYLKGGIHAPMIPRDIISGIWIGVPS
jgi:hypothetical protein